MNERDRDEYTKRLIYLKKNGLIDNLNITDKQKEMIEAFFFTDKTEKQVARDFGLSISSIRQRIEGVCKALKMEWKKTQTTLISLDELYEMRNKIDRYKKALEHVDFVLKEAIESIDNGDPVNGLEYAREVITKTYY